LEKESSTLCPFGHRHETAIFALMGTFLSRYGDSINDAPEIAAFLSARRYRFCQHCGIYQE